MQFKMDKIGTKLIKIRDVTTGATGATGVAPKFSDTLTLSPPRGADSAHHCRGRSYNSPVVTSLKIDQTFSSSIRTVQT